MDQKTDQNNKSNNTKNVATQAGLQCSPIRQQFATASIGRNQRHKHQEAHLSWQRAELARIAVDDDRNYQACTVKLILFVDPSLYALLCPAWGLLSSERQR